MNKGGINLNDRASCRKSRERERGKEVGRLTAEVMLEWRTHEAESYTGRRGQSGQRIWIRMRASAA